MNSLRWSAAIVLAALACALCDHLAGGANPDPSPPAAGPAPNGGVLLHNCLIKAVKTARLATDRPGVLSLVDPHEGDTVKEGQVVARLMDEVAQASYEVAKLVADDRVEIEYATRLNAVDKIEYSKSVATNETARGTIPDIELRRLKLAEERSALQIDKAKHEMAVNAMKATQAEAELKTYRIVAPFDGVVSQVLKFRGEAVRQGDPILDIVNTDVVHVEGKISERDIWRVKVGSPVRVVLDIPGADLDVENQVFEGKIGFVDPVAIVGDTRVWAEVPNPRNVLRPGFLATMTVLPAPPDSRNAGASLGHPTPPGSKLAARRDARRP
jgi:membrane fusion protein (multidrug efflux system)